MLYCVISISGHGSVGYELMIWKKLKVGEPFELVEIRIRCSLMWKRLMCSSKSAYCSTAVPYRKHPIMHLKCPIKRVKERNAKPESRKGGAWTSHMHMHNSEQGHLLESHSQTVNTGISFKCMKLFNKEKKCWGGSGGRQWCQLAGSQQVGKRKRKWPFQLRAAEHPMGLVLSSRCDKNPSLEREGSWDEQHLSGTP